MSNLLIEYHAPDALKPYQRNVRTHSKKQLRQIAASIETFGFTNPVLIDNDNMILAGHGRVEASRLIGLAEVAADSGRGMALHRARNPCKTGFVESFNGRLWNEGLNTHCSRALLTRAKIGDLAEGLKRVSPSLGNQPARCRELKQCCLVSPGFAQRFLSNRAYAYNTSKSNVISYHVRNSRGVATRHSVFGDKVGS